ncbi:hypothetical protein TcWFU_010481 [Taenia crassiceps]|uniref:Uncharacterized protein n=1 Tax=Taenia crassiceps TaxID=6207 RepID=A0ABR4Q7G7_9CEST
MRALVFLALIAFSVAAQDATPRTSTGLVILLPCVLLTSSVVQKDYMRMLKDYVKRLAESIGHFISEDELGTGTLEAGKSVINVLENARERAEVWLGKLIKRLLEKANSAPKVEPIKPVK